MHREMRIGLNVKCSVLPYDFNQTWDALDFNKTHPYDIS
jgi:hypothetical protein